MFFVENYINSVYLCRLHCVCMRVALAFHAREYAYVRGGELPKQQNEKQKNKNYKTK